MSTRAAQRIKAARQGFKKSGLWCECVNTGTGRVGSWSTWFVGLDQPSRTTYRWAHGLYLHVAKRPNTYGRRIFKLSSRAMPPSWPPAALRASLLTAKLEILTLAASGKLEEQVDYDERLENVDRWKEALPLVKQALLEQDAENRLHNAHG